MRNCVWITNVGKTEKNERKKKDEALFMPQMISLVQLNSA